MDTEFHRVTERRKLDKRDFRTGNDAHIKKMLPERPVTADAFNARALSNLQIAQCHGMFLFSMF